MAMLEVNHLAIQFGGLRAVDGFNVSIEKGQLYGLIGPNGAGKTTLIRHLTGIYRGDSGNVRIDGSPVYENREAKAKIAYIPDDLFYFKQANTLEMKKYYQGIYKTFNTELFDRLQEFFPSINVKRNIRRLSKGMQKQVAFWLAICTMPQVMILDEPVDGLDPVMRRQIWSIILSEATEHESTILVSSHNLRELEDICDHIGLLHKGGILLSRDLEDMKYHIHKLQCVIRDPEKEKELLEELNVVQYEKRGSLLTVIARGTRQEILMSIEEKNPVFSEVLPLTLEEIFISETEVAGYDIKEIIHDAVKG